MSRRVRQTYHATVEVATERGPDDGLPTYALEEYEVGFGWSGRGWLVVHIRLAAENLSQACATAVSLASAATGAQAIACEVLTSGEEDARRGIHPQPGAPPAPRLR